MNRQRTGRVWAVVLAAGEGTRMASLTRVLYGYDLPKQFAALDSEKTLLQRTMDRIASIAPPERTVVVVSDAYEALAREQLAGYPGAEVVTQPLNLGTGPGILLPLAHVLARDPGAAVGIFPSDHHIRRTEPFVEAVERALAVAPATETGVALLGAAAESAAPDLGWIVRGPRLGGRMERAWRVHRFIEKPPESVAMLLLGTGSLWNTMVVAGGGRSLWDLAGQHIPRQAESFEGYRRVVVGSGGAGGAGVRAVRDQLYRQLMPADFSREVLQMAQGLGVVPLIDSGWFDCGTPERLFDWLRTTPDMQHLLHRLQGAIARAGARKAPGVAPSVAA